MNPNITRIDQIHFFLMTGSLAATYAIAKAKLRSSYDTATNIVKVDGYSEADGKHLFSYEAPFRNLFHLSDQIDYLLSDLVDWKTARFPR